MEKEKLFKLTNPQLSIINGWKPETLVSKFQQLTKISDKTLESFKKLERQAQVDALVLYINKQSVVKTKTINSILVYEFGTIKDFKDGTYVFTDKGEGIGGWKKMVANQ